VGPISPTPTKPGRPGTGLGYVEEAAVLLGDPAGAPHARRAGGTGTSSGAVRSAAMPFFVTGGVAPETIPAIAAAGARRFVVVRYLTEAADPRSAAVRLRRAIDAALAQQD
jgi:thiamine-phosphate pyrophosphorylase